MRPAECSGGKPPSRPRIPCVYGLEVGVGGGLGCWEYVSRSLFRGFAAKGAPLWGEWRMWLLQWLFPFAVSRFARKARYFGMGGERGLLWQLIPTTNYPRHTCANDCSCYTCKCCFRAGWNSLLAVNRAVPKGCRGAGEASATEPMSPRPERVLVRIPAELVRSQYQRLESG